ncbi:MAG: M48 family metallopeptidase [Solirubrobacterales bacterium]
MADVPARFNDGRTAASRPVTVRLGTGMLELRDRDGLLVAAWHLGDVRSDGQVPGPTGGVRLRCTAEPDARLVVSDSAFVQVIAPAVTATAKPSSGWRTLALAAAGAAALMAAVVFGLPAASRQVAAWVPPSVEREWGTRLAEGLERQWGTCRGPAGNAALEMLASRLAGPLPAPLRPGRVAVVDVKMVNAVALPGGTVLVFRGLLDDARDADEVAGVLAHEMTHVSERHAAAAMIRGFGVGLLVTLITGDASGLAASGAATVLAGAYSREDEAAADAGATRLLAAAGIAPDGLAAFFRRIGGQTVIPAWISTHPDPEARARAVEAAARAKATAPALEPEQWQALKRVCG